VLKRICELLAVVLILASLGGLGLSLYFIYSERFIESVISGLLAFAFLRGGIVILRLTVAQASLSEAHRRVLEELDGKKKPPGTLIDRPSRMG